MRKPARRGKKKVGEKKSLKSSYIFVELSFCWGTDGGSYDDVINLLDGSRESLISLRIVILESNLEFNLDIHHVVPFSIMA
jgi:hypothetical protein